MKNEQLRELANKYGLNKNHFHVHKHYVIVNREGIETIQRKAGINIQYRVVKCEKDFCVVKAIATIKTENSNEITIETFGSALHGDFKNGTTQNWYVMEIAEKRAMSRAVLKMTGFYEQGVYSEDESEDFKKQSTEQNHSVNGTKVQEPVKSF